MRTLPVSFFWPEGPERTVAVSRGLTAMTHPAPAAEWCSGLYNLLVSHLLEGAEPCVALDAAASELRTLAPDLPHTELWTALQERAEGPPEGLRTPGGYCLDTLAAAIWAFADAPSAEDAIVRAVNLGGDADTVGAVAGGLAGARWGLGGLPPAWLGTLRGRQRLERVASAIRR